VIQNCTPKKSQVGFGTAHPITSPRTTDVSDNQVRQHRVEGGRDIGKRRTIGGAVGETAVDEPPEIGWTAGGSGEPCDRGAQLTLAHHVVVGQAPQRQVAQRKHFPDVDAEREHVGGRREGAVDGVGRREVGVDGGGGEQLGRGPAHGDEALTQRDVLGGVGVAAERRRAEFDVERRREQHVAGGDVAVHEPQVGAEVTQTGRNLAAQRQLLDDAERREAD